MPRIVMAGTSTPVQRVLHRIADLDNVELVALYTDLGGSPDVEKQCTDAGIELREIERMANASEANALRADGTDWLLSVNSTVLYPRAVLEAARCGALNMHPGRLPDYAGLHTHQWAIRNGEAEFGATLHWMTPELDAGPIAYKATFPITPKDTGLSLFVKCINAGADLVVRALCDIAEGKTPPRRPQDLSRRRVYTHRQALDDRIDWSRSAVDVVSFVRAADYRPFDCPTYTPTLLTKDGRRVAVRQVEVAEARNGEPGTVVSADANSVVVAAGDGQGVKLRIVEIDGATVKGPAIAEALALSVGDAILVPA